MTKTFPQNNCLLTEKFKDFLNSTPTDSTDTYYTFLSAYISSKGLSAYSSNLMSVLASKWQFYEIAGEDEDTQYSYLTSIVDIFSSFTLEVLTNYTKAFDYTTSILLTKSKTLTDHSTASTGVTSHSTSGKTESAHDDNNASSDTSNSSTETPNITHDEIELPNKVTSHEYVTSRSKDSGTTAVTGSGTVSQESHDVSTGSENITADGTNDISNEGSRNATDIESLEDKGKYLEAKKAYMEQIKNVYLDFAERFTDCFIHMFA